MNDHSEAINGAGSVDDASTRAELHWGCNVDGKVNDSVGGTAGSKTIKSPAHNDEEDISKDVQGIGESDNCTPSYGEYIITGRRTYLFEKLCMLVSSVVDGKTLDGWYGFG